MERTNFGLVRPEYSGPALMMVHFDRSGHFGQSDPKCPFPFDIIVAPLPLFYIPLSRTIRLRAVSRLLEIFKRQYRACCELAPSRLARPRC